MFPEKIAELGSVVYRKNQLSATFQFNFMLARIALNSHLKFVQSIYLALNTFNSSRECLFCRVLSNFFRDAICLFLRLNEKISLHYYHYRYNYCYY